MALGIGGILLVTAIAGPLVLMKVAPADGIDEPAVGSGLTPSRTAARVSEPRLDVARTARTLPAVAPAPDLLAGLFDGPVVPGQMAAGIEIGSGLPDVLGILPPETPVYRGIRQGRTTHTVNLGSLKIELATRARETKIDQVSLIAVDCAALLYHQQRPVDSELAGGVTVGSHLSRVERQIGQPLASLPGGRAGEDGPLEQIYPGLALSYCTDSQLIRRLTVFADPMRVPHRIAALAPPVSVVPDTALPSDPHPPERLPQYATLTQPRGGAARLPARSTVPETPDATRLPVAERTMPWQDAPDLDAHDLALAGLAPVRIEDEVPLRKDEPLALPHVERPEGPATVPQVTEMALDRTARRGVQVRLKLLGFDPSGADGIVGPKTRAAVIRFQTATGLTDSGMIDDQTLLALTLLSAKPFQTWEKVEAVRIAKAAAARRATRQIRISEAPRPRAAPECARDYAGEVIENQSFSCDVSLLRESINELLGG